MTDNLDQLRDAVFRAKAGLLADKADHYVQSKDIEELFKAAQKYLKLMEGIEGLYWEEKPNLAYSVKAANIRNQALDDVTKLMEEKKDERTTTI